MYFYFVGTDKSTLETEVIKELQPKRLLLSYFYFKNKSIKDYINKLGYRPQILLDSGAYSAFTSGRPVNLKKYMQYIEDNLEYIDNYISLDILGDSKESLKTWREMKAAGLDPIPVFHYNNNEAILEEYLKAGCEHIAIGGTVPIKSKNEVAEWLKLIAWQYPARYHLLGSSSRKILDHCDIESADASTWIMAAIMGKPRHIKGNDKASRKERALYNMRRLIDLYG